MHAYTQVPEDIGAYGPLADATGTRSFALKVLRVTAKGVIARIAGVSDRNGAEALKGTLLHAARAQLPPADDGAVYIADLVGATAVTAEGTVIGTIVDVPDHGAGPLLEIELADRRDTVLVPLAGGFVVSIDLDARRVVIDAVDGLLD